MKKLYMKPIAEFISLAADEELLNQAGGAGTPTTSEGDDRPTYDDEDF